MLNQTIQATTGLIHQQQQSSKKKLFIQTIDDQKLPIKLNRKQKIDLLKHDVIITSQQSAQQQAAANSTTANNAALFDQIVSNLFLKQQQEMQKPMQQLQQQQQQHADEDYDDFCDLDDDYMDDNDYDNNGQSTNTGHSQSASNMMDSNNRSSQMQLGSMAPVSEDDKRKRRAIANSNERRRMQSINAGFQTLKALIPHSSGEKLSKACILQRSADYMRYLNDEKDRLNFKLQYALKLLESHNLLSVFNEMNLRQQSQQQPVSCTMAATSSCTGASSSTSSSNLTNSPRPSASPSSSTENLLTTATATSQNKHLTDNGKSHAFVSPPVVPQMHPLRLSQTNENDFSLIFVENSVAYQQQQATTTVPLVPFQIHTTADKTSFVTTSKVLTQASSIPLAHNEQCPDNQTSPIRLKLTDTTNMQSYACDSSGLAAAPPLADTFHSHKAATHDDRANIEPNKNTCESTWFLSQTMMRDTHVKTELDEKLTALCDYQPITIKTRMDSSDSSNGLLILNPMQQHAIGDSFLTNNYNSQSGASESLSKKNLNTIVEAILHVEGKHLDDFDDQQQQHQQQQYNLISPTYSICVNGPPKKRKYTTQSLNIDNNYAKEHYLNLTTTTANVSTESTDPFQRTTNEKNRDTQTETSNLVSVLVSTS
jgi:hypothetical protein